MKDLQIYPVATYTINNQMSPSPQRWIKTLVQEVSQRLYAWKADENGCSIWLDPCWRQQYVETIWSSLKGLTTTIKRLLRSQMLHASTLEMDGQRFWTLCKDQFPLYLLVKGSIPCWIRIQASKTSSLLCIRRCKIEASLQEICR